MRRRKLDNLYKTEVVIPGKTAYTDLKKTKEGSVIREMLYETVYGDVDDMIFADCDWHPSER